MVPNQLSIQKGDYLGWACLLSEPLGDLSSSSSSSHTLAGLEESKSCKLLMEGDI